MNKKSHKPQKSTPSEMEKVYSRLYEMIINGQLGQGARLVERDLARQFSVSRTPVREAIQRMEQDGLVERNKADRYARPVVATMNEKEMAELHEIVASLEALAARCCAALPLKKRKSLVKKMKALNLAYSRACFTEPFDVDLAVKSDHAFHSAYITEGAGRRVASMRRAVKPQTQRYIRTFLPAIIQRLEESVKEHDDIITAIEKGDETGADKAVRKNWGKASRRLGQAMALWNPSISKTAGRV
ncbi:MAG: GntR family transcriptional regulator [Alphaproteobacteria bacterium]